MTGNISGKALCFSVNGTFLNGPFAWRKRGSADKLDGTTGLDGEFGSTKAGIVQAEVTLQLIINILSGIVIVEDSVLTNLQLYYAFGDTTPSLSFPVFTVLTAEKGAEARGRFELTVTGENDGPYTENR